MNRRNFLIALTLATSTIAFADGLPKIKVACVGDSITEGAGVRDPNKKYPAQLGVMLGANYDVKNFGVSGSTMLDNGDLPYKKQAAFNNALAFAPDIVVIKLGTNDSKPQNWSKKEGFAESAKSLVDAFRKANFKTKIYLCYPVPVIAQGNWGINNEKVKGEIIPLIKQVATEKGTAIIDTYAALDGKPQLFPDRVHPNDEGAGLIAKAVFEAIKKK